MIQLSEAGQISCDVLHSADLHPRASKKGWRLDPRPSRGHHRVLLRIKTFLFKQPYFHILRVLEWKIFPVFFPDALSIIRDAVAKSIVLGPLTGVQLTGHQ